MRPRRLDAERSTRRKSAWPFCAIPLSEFQPAATLNFGRRRRGRNSAARATADCSTCLYSCHGSQFREFRRAGGPPPNRRRRRYSEEEEEEEDYDASVVSVNRRVRSRARERVAKGLRNGGARRPPDACVARDREREREREREGGKGRARNRITCIDSPGRRGNGESFRCERDVLADASCRRDEGRPRGTFANSRWRGAIPPPPPPPLPSRPTPIWQWLWSQRIAGPARCASRANQERGCRASPPPPPTPLPDLSEDQRSTRGINRALIGDRMRRVTIVSSARSSSKRRRGRPREFAVFAPLRGRRASVREPTARQLPPRRVSTRPRGLRASSVANGREK